MARRGTAPGLDERRRRTLTIAAHLSEFRRRMMWAALGVILGAVAGWFLADPVWAGLRIPLEATSAGQGREAAINFTTLMSAFDTKLQIALVVGVVASCPLWLYQVLAFLVPGLTRRESRYVLGFLLPAIPLFLSGCAMGWLVVPHIVEIMVGFAVPGSTTFLSAREYLDFVLKLMLATGVAFVLPLLLVVLNAAGVVSGRAILKAWRWAVLAITIFTALATPAADILAMLVLAVPMVALYFAAVGIALLHDRRAARGPELASRTESEPIGSA